MSTFANKDSQLLRNTFSDTHPANLANHKNCILYTRTSYCVPNYSRDFFNETIYIHVGLHVGGLGLFALAGIMLYNGTWRAYSGAAIIVTVSLWLGP